MKPVQGHPTRGISLEAGVSSKTSRCKKTPKNLPGAVTKAGVKLEAVLDLQSRTAVEVKDALNAAKMATFHENVPRLVSEATTEVVSNVVRRVIWPESALTPRLREIEADGDADVEAAIVLEAQEPATSVRKKVTWLVIVLKLEAMTGTETTTGTEIRAALTKDLGETTTEATRQQRAKKTHGATLTSKRMAGVHQAMPNGEINANYT
jgi:hypothetical protein